MTQQASSICSGTHPFGVGGVLVQLAQVGADGEQDGSCAVEA